MRCEGQDRCCCRATEPAASVVHLSCTDYFRGLQAKASREDPQAPEHHLLSSIEQVVAPGDGVPQGLLALREVPRTAHEEPEPPVQTRQDGVRRQEPDPSRG